MATVLKTLPMFYLVLVSALNFVAAAEADWTLYRHDLDNSGFVASASKQNALYLHKRWTYIADTNITSTPTEAYGLVYVGTWSGDAIALDATTGKRRWKAHLDVNPDEAYGGPRGVIGSIAIDHGTVFAASGGCAIAAFNAMTGEQRWYRRICDIRRNDDVYASPVIADGLVLIGTDILVDRPTSRGRELALDANTGAIRWSIEPAQYRGTGTGVSATPAVDRAAGTLYLGTGNATPMLSPPAGDDPGSESILALDIASGRTRWSFGPVHPHDVNDNDFFGSPNRFNLGSRSHPRWAIGEGNKDGVYYAVDAKSGKLLWRRSIAPSRPSSMVVGTAAVGAGAIFVPLYDGDIGSLTALRATDGAILWQRATAGESEAPALWGSVVFTTEATGWLDAFRAGTGRPLGRWRLCGRAAGRGPSVAQGGLYVASGKCLTYFVTSE